MKPEYRAKSHYQKEDVATRYEDERFKSWYGRTAHQTEVRALARAMDLFFKGPGILIDIPCGTGRLFPVFMERGMKVVGLDISEAMMQVARKRFEKANDVSFRRADAEHLPFQDGSVDYLTSYRFLCHLPEDVRRRVLTEMIRVTRKVLILNYYVSNCGLLYIFNRIFRKSTVPPHVLSLKELKRELDSLPSVRVREIRKLSWYDRSSTLVVLDKTI